MDDLFQDVEQLLDMKPSAPTQPPELAFGALQPPPAAEVSEGLERAMPLAPRLENLDLQQINAAANHLAEVDPALLSPEVAAPTPPPQKTESKVNYLLLAVSCVSVIAAWGAWWLYQDKQRQQAAISPQLDMVATVDGAGTQQFANYVQKSLQNIDQQSGLTSGTALAPNKNEMNPGLPTVVIPRTGLPPSASTSIPSSSSREYIPVYQLPANLYPPGKAISPLPNLPKPQSSAATKRSSPVAKSEPGGVSRKLVGVLEQGNNSVALFEINGVTQRFEMGESIGSSGWTLVEVSKNQAIIRRNGDVRSLFVGNNF